MDGALGLGAALLSAAGPAHAFCGFYISGADAKLFNNATMVVMMRDGLRMTRERTARPRPKRQITARDGTRAIGPASSSCESAARAPATSEEGRARAAPVLCVRGREGRG